MEFEVLGPIRFRSDSGEHMLGGALQLTLLGVLLANANRSVGADALIDALWGAEPDERGLRRLQLHAHRLRRALGDPERLRWEGGGYRLLVSPGELDAERFDSLVGEAIQVATHHPGRGVDLVRKALGLWRGEPYDGLDSPQLADIPFGCNHNDGGEPVCPEGYACRDALCVRPTNCAELAEEILRTCPHVQILATSREALRIGGETAFAVPALELPDASGPVTASWVATHDRGALDAAVADIVSLGLPAETARRLAIQTALGAAQMAQQSDKTPAELKRNVMSPGGTTERAIEHLESAGLRRIVHDALDACAARAREMADELGKH